MLIVSCCNNQGGIYSINERTLAVRKIHDDETRGIDIDGDMLFSAHTSGVRKHKMRMDCEDVFLDMLAENTIVSDLRHGVLCQGDSVWVVNAGEDAIYIHDAETLGVLGRIETRPAHPGKRCHTNDISPDDNGAFVFSAFSVDPISNYHKGNGCIKVLDKKVSVFPCNTSLVMDGLVRPHSPVVNGDNLYFCESGTGRIMSFDINYEFGRLITEDSGFLRGLLVDDDWIYYGISFDRNMSKKPLGNHRCGVVRMKRSDGKKTFVQLPSEEVYCIRRYTEA